jgi:dTDP-4-dehydrorhamnose reductase
MSETAPIVVLGGGGRIGSELLGGLRRARVPLRGFARKELDIASRPAVARALCEVRPRLVINAAGYSNVDEAECDRARAERENAHGPAILAAQTAAEGIALIHLSTSYIFNGRKGRAYCEDDPVCPISVYGATKASGEDAVRSANSRHIILRTAGVFGASIDCFPKTVLRMADSGHPIYAAIDLRGSPTPVDHLVSAILAVVGALESGSARWGTYNLAGAIGASRYELAKAVLTARERALGVRTALISAMRMDFGSKARRPRNAELDSTLFASTFGAAPGPWNEATETFVESYYRSFTLPVARSRTR